MSPNERLCCFVSSGCVKKKDQQFTNMLATSILLDDNVVLTACFNAANRPRNKLLQD